MKSVALDCGSLPSAIKCFDLRALLLYPPWPLSSSSVLVCNNFVSSPTIISAKHWQCHVPSKSRNVEIRVVHALTFQEFAISLGIIPQTKPCRDNFRLCGSSCVLRLPHRHSDLTFLHQDWICLNIPARVRRRRAESSRLLIQNLDSLVEAKKPTLTPSLPTFLLIPRPVLLILPVPPLQALAKPPKPTSHLSAPLSLHLPNLPTFPQAN